MLSLETRYPGMPSGILVSWSGALWRLLAADALHTMHDFLSAGPFLNQHTLEHVTPVH